MADEYVLKSLKIKEAQILKKIEEVELLQKQLAGIRIAIEVYQSETNYESETNEEEGDDVDVANLSIPKKALFGLKKIKSGFVDDVLTVLWPYHTDITDEEDKKKFKGKIGQSLSILKGDGKILGEEVGVKTRYHYKNN